MAWKEHSFSLEESFENVETDTAAAQRSLPIDNGLWISSVCACVCGGETNVHLLLPRLLLNETFNGDIYEPTQLRAQGSLRIVFPSTLTALRESIQVICQSVVSRPINR